LQARYRTYRFPWNVLRIVALLVPAPGGLMGPAHEVRAPFSRSPPGTSVSSPTPLTTDLCRNDRLAAITNMHMLDGNDLTAVGSGTLQGKEAGLIGYR